VVGEVAAGERAGSRALMCACWCRILQGNRHVAQQQACSVWHVSVVLQDSCSESSALLHVVAVASGGSGICVAHSFVCDVGSLTACRLSEHFALQAV
jgi:hypothetical protein